MATSLEKKAEKNIMESIEKLVLNSFLMLLFESLMLTTNPSLKDTLKEKNVKGIYDYIINTIVDLRRVVDDGGEKEHHLRKCLQMKEDILEVFDVVRIYISACNIVDFCFEEQIQLLENNEAESFPFAEMKKLLKQKTESIMDDAIKHDIEEAASSILFAVLPNYFSDAELIDYLTYSARFYFENSPVEEGVSHVRQIMRNYAPQKSSGYGKHYAKDAEKLSEIIEKLRLGGVGGDLGKIISRYEGLFDKIEGISDALVSIYSALTYISILVSSMFTFDDILKGNAVYLDYFNKTVELLGGQPDESAAETMLERLDDMIESEVGQLNEITKRKELIYKNVNFENFSENTKTLFSMEFFLTTAFFENIEDAADMILEGAHSDAPADIKTAQKEVKALTLFIKENCLGMGEMLKRSARRNLFLSMPLASYYDKGKMMKYVDKLCDKIKGVSEMDSAISSVEKIIDDEMVAKLSSFEY